MRNAILATGGPRRVRYDKLVALLAMLMALLWCATKRFHDANR